MTATVKPASSKNSAGKSGETASSASSLNYRTLEPRIVFDGAGAALIASAMHGADKAVESHRAGPTFDSAHVAADQHHDALVASLHGVAGAIAAKTAPAQIVFIESNLPDTTTLLKDVPHGAQVVMLDSTKDGMDQIAAYLAGRSNVGAIHILSHGSAAEVDLGTAKLTTGSLSSTYAADIATIKAALGPNADILIYGCDVAQGSAGHAFVQALATATGDNVAASTDITGAATLGGNWALEDQVGTIHTATIDASDWNGDLAAAASNGRGALLTVTGNNIYSVDTGTGKATLVTTIPGSVGGVAFSGVANSLAVDQANGLIYYTDNAVSSSNVALFAYDFVNDKHILINSDVATFGVAPGSVGLGAAGATFANGKLYLGVDNPTGTEDEIYAVTFTNSGRTIAAAVNLHVNLPLTNDWGDLGYDPVNNNLLSFSGADLTVTRINPTTGATIGTALAMPAGAGYQGSQDLAGDVYAVGSTIQQINPLTGAAVGSAITVTTDGSTALGGANDAAGWTPPTATIGGQIYWDNNANKTFDTGDVVAANVTVQIYSDVNNDGVVNGQDALLATDTTDASGHYQFTNILPGDYIVKVSDANGVIGTHTYTSAGGAVNTTGHVAIIGSTISNIDFGVANTITATNDTFSTYDNTPVTIHATGNDSDPQGDAFGITAVNGTSLTTSGPSVTVTGGSVALDASGDLVFTPTTGYNGAPSFTYTVTDSHGATATATASGTVSYAPPVAVNDTFATNANTAITLDVRSNDTDVNGFPLTITKIGTTAITAGGAAVAVTDGSVKLNTDGTLTFTPTANFTGAMPAFSYTESDGHGNTATATVTGSVVDVPPVASDDTFTTAQGSAVAISALANDTSPVGLPLTVTKINATAITAGGAAVSIDHGTVSESAAGAFTYTPTAGYSGSEAFTYTISDGHGGTATANVTGAVYAPPTLVADTFGTPKDTAVTIPVLANDTDVNGFPPTITKIGSTAITAGGSAVAVTDGTVKLNTDGTLTFAPITGYTGAVPAFTYTVSDGHGGTATATVTGTVYAPPVAIAEAFTTPYDTSVTINALANDTDANGFPLTITKINGAAFTVGTPVAVTDGTVTVNADNTITFTPTAGYKGAVPAFTYTIDDGRGGTATASDTGTVYAPPIAFNDTFTTAAGSSVVFHPLANDTDPNAGFTLKIADINGAHVTVGTPIAITDSVTGLAAGTITVDASNNITFTPAAGYSGTPSFTYTDSDGHGGTATATVNGTVWAPPVATNDTFDTGKGVPVTIASLANDTDPNGFPLGIKQVNGTAVTTGGAAVAIDHGTVALNMAGNLVYTPTAGYTGPESFTYTISDGHGGTDTATDSGTIYAPPVAGNDVFTTALNTPTTIPVTSNDTDVNGFSLTVIQVNGTKLTAGDAPVSVTGGAVTLDASNNLIFTPATGISGNPSFTYTISDGHGGTAQATVNGTVWAAPVAKNDTFSTAQDLAVAISPLANDTDPNAGFALSVATVNGQSITAGGAPITIGHGTVALTAAGQFIYTPAAGYNGAEVFNYTVSDGHGGTAAANVSGLVYGPPVATDDTFSTHAGTPAVVAVLANDTDPNAFPLSITTVNGSLISAGGAPVAVTGGSVTLDVTGKALTFSANAGFIGPATFTYGISDGHGGTDTANVTGNIYALPAATNDTFTTAAGVPAVIPVLANDTDASELPLTVTAINGMKIVPGGQVFVVGGSVSLDAANELTFTPNAGYLGKPSFTYTITDGQAATSTALVTGAIASPPVAGNDTFSTTSGIPVTIAVLANDTDANGFPLTVSQINGTAITAGGAPAAVSGGSVALDGSGTLTFAPNAGYSGTPSFEYTESDGHGGTATATVTGIVVPVSAPFMTPEDVPVIIPAASGVPGLAITAVNGQPINAMHPVTLADLAGQPIGVVALNPDGTLTFTPATGYVGTPSFTYTAVDPSGDTATATVPGTVTDVPPMPANDHFLTAANTPVVIPVLANDTAIAGNVIHVVAVNGSPIDATHPVTLADGSGFVSLNPNGTLTFSPASGYTGQPSFRYTVADQHGGTAMATVSGSVWGPPVTTPDIFATAAGKSVTFAPLTIDTDPNGFALTITEINGKVIVPGAKPVAVTGGTVSIDPTGNLTFVPDQGYSGAPSFNYTVDDGHGGSTPGSVAGIVYAPPTLLPDMFTTVSGSPVTFEPLANDRDPNGFKLSISQIDDKPIVAGGAPVAVAGGTVTLDPAGNLIFLPKTGFADTLSFNYTADDGHGGSAHATISGIVLAPPVLTKVPFAPAIDLANSLTSFAAQPTADGAVEAAVNGTFGEQSSVLSLSTAQAALGGEPTWINRNNAVHDAATRFSHVWSDSDFGTATSGIGSWSPVTMIGSSLRISATTFAAPDGISPFMVQSHVHDGVLALTFEAIDVPPGRPHIVDYRVTQTDGRALPSWMERPSIDLIQGRRAANAEDIDLTVTAVYSDGTQISESLRVHSSTGVIEALPGRRADSAPKMFGQQFANYGNLDVAKSNALAALLDMYN